MQALGHFPRLIPVVALLASISPAPGFAQTGAVESDAIALLRRATDYLSSMDKLRVETHTTIEAVVPSGEKLQFLHHVVITAQRPNKLRAERIGELIAQTFYYDGESLSVSLPEMQYHATVAAPPTIDATLDFARDELGVIAPASDLIYGNAFARLSEGLTSAYVVGKAVVGDVPCTHIAFRNPEVDWQLWIEDGDKPLPRKFIVTSKKMPQSPQFQVLMTKWDSSPRLSDATFSFTPAAGSQPIDFLPTASAN